MLKQKTRKIVNSRYLLMSIGLAALLLTASFAGQRVRADQYDQKIKALQAQNNHNQQIADMLASQASGYQDAINRLQAQIDSLQHDIAINQAKQSDLKRRIAEAEAEITQQRKTLAEIVKAMYLDGQSSTIEILASSSDLSQFVDNEQYRSLVQQKIATTVQKIKDLKAQLQKQKKIVEALLADEQNQNAQLASAQHKQANLLNYTEAQKANFDKKISDNNSQIAALRAAQLAANQQLGGQVEPGDPGHGGYPAYLDNAAQDTIIDPWGMFNRECVSYTAWKVEQTFGHMPNWGGHGNANQWPDNARADGIPVGYTPRVHSVAISYSYSGLGHAMWVESVNGNYVHVSQYNFDMQGHYSEMTVRADQFVYIYFR